MVALHSILMTIPHIPLHLPRLPPIGTAEVRDNRTLQASRYHPRDTQSLDSLKDLTLSAVAVEKLCVSASSNLTTTGRLRHVTQRHSLLNQHKASVAVRVGDNVIRNLMMQRQRDFFVAKVMVDRHHQDHQRGGHYDTTLTSPVLVPGAIQAI